MLLRQLLARAALFATMLHVLVGASCAGDVTTSTRAAAASPWATIVVGTQSTSEKLATRDLCRYIAQVMTTAPQVLSPEQWRRAPRPAVIVGTAASNPMLGNQHAKDSGAEGFILQNQTLRGVPVITASAATSEGAVNAIYGLLRNVGFGFYLGSESAPSALPEQLATSPIVQQPSVAIRGVLPWYNFLNSPTVWDPVDHRAFIDQLIRMGANFVGFHSYDNEPFAAISDNGKMVHGKRLASTGESVWSTRPLPTRSFAAGTSELFPLDSFGAVTTLEPDADTAIRREQEVMRDALNYARQRGLHCCIGFEVTGNPTHPAEREIFQKRFNHILDQYPAADYVWIWQPEGRGAGGMRLQHDASISATAVEAANPLALYGDARRNVFDRVVTQTKANPRYFLNNETGRQQRAAEGARLEQYAQLAIRLLRQRHDAPKLIICGWGGEDRMISAEYYDGLDKLLPSDVVFASLDYIIPRERIDSIYSQLPKDRQRWPMPWLEYDGDQWHPQPLVQTFEGIFKQVRQSGSQGFLGIHWRTREVEQNLAYMVQAAWNPDLTADEFFKDYARRCYPAPVAAEMADVESKLDALGYRWVGGRGQAEYNVFTWGPGEDPAKVAALTDIRDRVAKLVEAETTPHLRIQWLLHRIEYVLAYQATGEAVVQARALLETAANDTETSVELARRALDLLTSNPLDKALQHYARRVTTRGEHGVLATINTKAWPAWLDLYKRCCEVAGERFTTPTTRWKPEPQILLPRHHGSVPEGEMMELMPIVLGGKVAYIHYRRLGTHQFQTEQLHLFQRWVYYATIPAAVVGAPGVEFGFSFSEDPAAPMTFGPVAVTAMPHAESMKASALRDMKRGGELAAKITSEDGNQQLRWKDVPEAEHFSIEKNGRHYCDTAVPFMPLSREHPATAYTIKAWARGKLLRASREIKAPATR